MLRMTLLDLLASLRSFDAWKSSDPTAVAAGVGDLVKGFRATGDLLGEHRLPELVHEGTGIAAALVPGGAYVMGFSEVEITERMVSLGESGSPGYRHWSDVYQKLFAEAGARPVELRPFICSRAPVLEPLIADWLPSALGHCPLAEEDEPDLTPLTSEEAAAEDELWNEEEWEEDEWEDEEGRPEIDPYPAFVRREEAAEILDRYGSRPISDAEWEFVARGGGHASWIATNPWKFVDDSRLHPQFKKGSRWTRATSNALGIWGVALPEWTASTNGEGLALRGGAVMGFPWQDSAEEISAHAATKASWSGRGGVRLVWDLPQVKL